MDTIKTNIQQPKLSNGLKCLRNTVKTRDVEKVVKIWLFTAQKVLKLKIGIR